MMDFQIQFEHAGTSRERAQITFRDSDGQMLHQPIEITEWSQSGDSGVRTVQGRLVGIAGIHLIEDEDLLDGG